MKRLAAGLLLVALAGCGYNTRFELPPHIRTFSVATFTNRTLERNLDFEFTQAVIQEILAKTDLRVARPGEADLLVSGSVDGFDRGSLRRRRRGENVEVRFRLYASMTLFDRKKDRLLFRGEQIQRRAEVGLARGETARQGREEVVRELARRVVGAAFERWPEPPMETQGDGG